MRPLVLLALLGIGCTPTGSLPLRSGVVVPSDPGDGPAVVVFDRALRADDRDRLRASGWDPVAPVGRGWLTRHQGGELPPGAWVGALDPSLKVEPSLREPGTAIGVAQLAPGADPLRLRDALVAAGLPVDGVGRRLVARLREDQVEPWVDLLAEDPEVLWVSRRGPRRLLDATTSGLAQSGVGSAGTPFFDAGLDGRGQIGAIIDTGIDLDHCLFVDDLVPPAINTDGTEVALDARKVIAVDFLLASDDPEDPLDWDNDIHGTHVAGILAGDQHGDRLPDSIDGSAPGAKLVIQDGGAGIDDCADLEALGCPVVDLVPLFEQAWEQGARVHSNSWGDRENARPSNVYSDGSVDADEESWNRPDYLLVFAAGNDGGTNQVFSPSNAKNTLSVGATRAGAAADTMEGFSSGGPTADGRLKPDLVFPGTVASAYGDGDVTTGNCDGVTLQGTSMATPGLAGLALVVRQYYVDGWAPTGAPVAADGFEPTSALVKATLIASARRVDDELEFTGFGRPQLDRALPLATDAARRVIALDEPDTTPFTGGDPAFVLDLEVLSADEELVVALVWRDPPGTPISDPVLVNDLDLVVEGGGETWLGNQFARFWSKPGGEADRLNNVEVVRIEAPSPGAWHLEVTAPQVAIGPQPFALVVSGAVVAKETGTGTTGDTASAPTDDPRGCGCDHQPASAAPIGLLPLLLVRRRRR